MLLGLVLPACIVAAQSSSAGSPVADVLASLDQGLAAAHVSAHELNLRHLSELPTTPGSAADGDRARALASTGRGRGGMGGRGRGGMGGRGGPGQRKTGASKAGASNATKTGGENLPPPSNCN